MSGGDSAEGMASHCSRVWACSGPQTVSGFDSFHFGRSCIFIGASLSKYRRSGIQRVQAGPKSNSDGKSSPISFGDRLLDYIEGNGSVLATSALPCY